ASVVAGDELLQWKRAYLNVPFFLLRAAIYFAAWNAISYWLNKWAVEQDRTADPQVARKMQKISAAGLVVYGLTITFASFDWLAFHRHRAHRVSLRDPVRAAAVTHDEARGRADCESGDRHPVCPSARSVLAHRAGVSHQRHRGELGRSRAADLAGRAVAGCFI